MLDCDTGHIFDVPVPLRVKSTSRTPILSLLVPGIPAAIATQPEPLTHRHLCANMYTTASVFFKTLADAGLTHAFVNWGSDHPAFLEDLQRQRKENDGKTLLEIVTCPSEFVALSAAQGFAQVTGRPAVVIVHVDVGTQVSTVGSIVHSD